MALSDRLRLPTRRPLVITLAAAAFLALNALLGAVASLWWASLLVVAAALALLVVHALAGRRRGLRTGAAFVTAAALVVTGGYAVDPAPVGEQGWTVRGAAQVVVGRDGDVLVLTSGARDLGTGEERWVADGTVLAVVDGVAVVQGGDAVRGVDVASGDRLWERDLPEVQDGGWDPVVTAADGVVVLRRDHPDDDGGGLGLRATTGETVWEVPDGWLSARSLWIPSYLPVAEAFVVHGHERFDDPGARVLAAGTGEVVRADLDLSRPFVVRGSSLVVNDNRTGPPRGVLLDGSGRTWTWTARLAFVEGLERGWDAVDADGAAEVVDLATGGTERVPYPDGWTYDEALEGPVLALRDGPRLAAWNPRSGAMVVVAPEDDEELDVGDDVRVEGDDERLLVAHVRQDRIGRDYTHVVVDDGARRTSFDWSHEGWAGLQVVAGVAVLVDRSGLRVVPLG
ncbi:hypothetical protein L615_006100000230 [Nocardioides sp. J9]|uniref:PQQ-binding-like beta-propeller repeat protein n=1 Tax=unclassified Nocardioides TaxID=2615069 RepID=UPI00048BF5EB|nr:MULTISPECIES: PQQ-binding-like beta-propeller repeat protein [unclassified Nocardioides]TWG93538.1 hypothetical protein L615_006100000230 [Nocardioides sp. J9]